MTKLDKLKAPIQPNEVEWRVQSAGANNTTVVPYLTNRCVMNRFDEAFGSENWQNDFTTWREKGVKCTISVRDVNTPDNWVSKSDGADETNIEATKGGFSDAMKRAAVQWGLGRDLYDYPRVMIEGQHKFIPDWADERLDKLVSAQIEGKLSGRKIVILKQNG